MIKKSGCVLILAFVSFLNGCAGMGGVEASVEHKIIERDGVDVVLIPATYREVYFSPSTSKERHCRAPDPDFSVQQNEQLNMVLPVNGGENIGGGEVQTGMNLGGRTERVLIARELMYRACELSANINADNETSIAIYDKFLQAFKALVSDPVETAVND